MEVTTHSTEETKKLAEQLAAQIKEKATAGSIPHVVALYGDLGSGKTTFTRFLVEALGFESRVQSPTFVIIRTYSGVNSSIYGEINHIDLYRIGSKEALEDLGLEELFVREKTLNIIEWPELAEDLIGEHVVRIYFKDLGENKREIKVEGI